MTSEEFRAHFPIFETTAHLCSCSEGALSHRAIVAMSEFMTSWRVEGAPWHRWMQEVDRARDAFARLIHTDSRNIAVVSCASEGAYHIASTLDYGDRRDIVTTDLEFPSVAHVWLAAKRFGARTRFVAHHQGIIHTEDIVSALNEHTGLLSVPVASYANGLRFDIPTLTASAHAKGIRVFVDAYQGAGVVPVDVQAWDCDFLVSGSLKYLLGAPGLAFLYVKPGSEPLLEPTLTGWFARQDPFAFTPKTLDYADDARRFQTGTPAIPAAYAAHAGLSLLNEQDSETIWTHVQRLAGTLQQACLDEGLELTSPLDSSLRGPQVAVRAQNADALATYLQRQGIIASPRGPAVRLSLHYYNNLDDLSRAVAGIAAFRQQHGLLR